MQITHNASALAKPVIAKAAKSVTLTLPKGVTILPAVSAIQNEANLGKFTGVVE